MPVNPPKKVTPADRAKAAAGSNRALAAVVLGMVAGFLAAGDVSVLAVPFTLAAALVCPKR